MERGKEKTMFKLIYQCWQFGPFHNFAYAIYFQNSHRIDRAETWHGGPVGYHKNVEFLVTIGQPEGTPRLPEVRKVSLTRFFMETKVLERRGEKVSLAASGVCNILKELSPYRSAWNRRPKRVSDMIFHGDIKVFKWRGEKEKMGPRAAGLLPVYAISTTLTVSIGLKLGMKGLWGTMKT